MLKKEDGLIDAFPYIYKHPELMSRGCFLFNIEGTDYYFKRNIYLMQELVASEIYKILGIPCVDYELIKLWNEYYVMSKSFRNPNHKYYSGWEITSSYLENKNEDYLKELGIDIQQNGEFSLNNIENIWFALEEKNVSQDDIRNILVELIKTYSLQIILMDGDYHMGNWEIEEDENHKFSLVPKFDNGGCFDNENNTIFMSVDGEDTYNNYLSSLKKFINYSDSEDVKIFLDMFEKCNIEIVKQAITNLKEKYGKHYDLLPKTVKEDEILDIFAKQRSKIENVLNETKARK